MPAYTIISFFGGKSPRTSVLILRSKNGRRISCSFDTVWCLRSSTNMSSSVVAPWVFWPILRKPNHDWKTFKSSKIAGLTKLRRLHNSSRLFWIGVPLSNSRLEHRIRFNDDIKVQRWFFRRCPSSTTRYVNSPILFSRFSSRIDTS